jgi:hypothetical protein
MVTLPCHMLFRNTHQSSFSETRSLCPIKDRYESRYSGGPVTDRATFKSPLKPADRQGFLSTSLFNRTEVFLTVAKHAESEFWLLASDADVKNYSRYPSWPALGQLYRYVLILLLLLLLLLFLTYCNWVVNQWQ